MFLGRSTAAQADADAERPSPVNALAPALAKFKSGDEALKAQSSLGRNQGQGHGVSSGVIYFFLEKSGTRVAGRESR